MPHTLIAVIALTAGSMQTPSVAPGGAQILDALIGCQRIPDTSKRLQCFDQAAAAAAAARGAGDLVVIDRETVRKSRRSLFGFLLPRDPLLEVGPKEPEIKEIKTTVVSSRSAGAGLWRFELRDAGTWVTQESSSAIYEPRPGTPVELKKGALGGYFLEVQGRTVRAARVR